MRTGRKPRLLVKEGCRDSRGGKLEITASLPLKISTTQEGRLIGVFARKGAKPGWNNFWKEAKEESVKRVTSRKESRKVI